MAAAGEIETLVLDGFSFVADFKGVEIGKGSGKTEGDKWSYYRQLKGDLTWLVDSSIMTLISRHKLNIVLTMHLHRQTDEDKQKQTSQDVDLLPRIEGGYRQVIAALPRALIYLHEKTIKVETQSASVTPSEYLAFCRRVRVPRIGVIPAKKDRKSVV